MARLVQTPATALLSLLTSKDGGIGPASFSDDIVGTVDLAPHLGLNFRQALFASGNAAENNNRIVPLTGNHWLDFRDTFGGGPGMVVPEGEVWRLHWVCWRFTNGTGGPLVQAGWSSRSNSASGLGLFAGPEVTSAIGATGSYTLFRDYQGIIVGPGTGPLAHIVQPWALAATDFEAAIWALVERYRI